MAAQCCVARKSQAVVMIKPKAIAMLAGAVEDKDEWIALMTGKRTDDGWHTVVDGFVVPPQKRGPATADMEPVKVDPTKVVGIVHSHNSMQAFFSGTDTGEDGVNEFPISLVVAQTPKTEMEKTMGFAWKCEAKAELGCGKLARVPAMLGVEGVKFLEAPEKEEAEASQQTVKDGDVGYCPFKEEGGDFESLDELTMEQKLPCGLTTQRSTTGMFGTTDTLLDIIKDQTKPSYTYANNNWYQQQSQQQGGYYTGGGTYMTENGNQPVNTRDKDGMEDLDVITSDEITDEDQVLIRTWDPQTRDFIFKEVDLYEPDELEVKEK